jgi:hypothetical protein
MKRIDGWLVKVTLVCIVLLLQLVQARDHPSQCINSAEAPPALMKQQPRMISLKGYLTLERQESSDLAVKS